MAISNWTNTITKLHFNPNNVRDPTIVFNNTANPIGSAPGYDGTQYDFQPKNFPPNTNVSAATTWTTILLGQFGVGPTAKEVILTGNCGITGPNEWKGVIYCWFRRPGSNWDLSPIVDGSYQGSFTVHAPVGLVNGEPAIEMAWGVRGLNLGQGDEAYLNIILSGWGE
jgi:hypothetical protein